MGNRKGRRTQFGHFASLARAFRNCTDLIDDCSGGLARALGVATQHHGRVVTAPSGHSAICPPRGTQCSDFDAAGTLEALQELDELQKLASVAPTSRADASELLRYAADVQWRNGPRYDLSDDGKTPYHVSHFVQRNVAAALQTMSPIA